MRTNKLFSVQKVIWNENHTPYFMRSGLLFKTQMSVFRSLSCPIFDKIRGNNKSGKPRSQQEAGGYDARTDLTPPCPLQDLPLDAKILSGNSPAKFCLLAASGKASNIFPRRLARSAR
mmetsp:Transcript_31087/g.45496  ORF Transcript_31087/g.45496 Transcript_31087/m.45496 type:complete len:118 (+) Transcript_31087:1432-1785(+)